MVTWPQPIHRNHSPSDLGFINLKFLPSVQYGHRITSDILNLLGSGALCSLADLYAEFRPAYCLFTGKLA